MSASKIARYYQVIHCIVQIDLSIFKSFSLESALALSKNRLKEDIGSGQPPNTYVPARNALFLAYAMGQAEILDAQEIYLGANALDTPSYPECTLSYIQAFQ
ncbi:hypothetical protein NEOC84_001777|uniref:7-cyano-7-deazaguanine synthase n=1 Tax=Neochlamydia sp. AcF84 TaxID=2315858 RepID=UPI00140A4AFA|nr:7-cyano-7-deazaguanine synthase [Neochlamydia sp. AcF84]NGY95848.1 hypothetical protein [Neochlamydia sp. AcF84]